jgi:hypothetical protein
VQPTDKALALPAPELPQEIALPRAHDFE